jgi:hypothetical protein
MLNDYDLGNTSILSKKLTQAKKCVAICTGKIFRVCCNHLRLVVRVVRAQSLTPLQKIFINQIQSL